MFIKPVRVNRALLGAAITALSLVFSPFTAGNPLDQIQQLNNRPTQNIIMNEQEERFASNNITPFEIAISDEDLQDLRERLQRTRLPDQLNEVSWEYGSDLDYMREILGYWQDDFDWREPVSYTHLTLPTTPYV